MTPHRRPSSPKLRLVVNHARAAITELHACPHFDLRDDRCVSLTALDVGFDLRLHDMAVYLPSDVIAVKHDAIDGTVQIASGSLDEIVATVTAAGYRVTL